MSRLDQKAKPNPKPYIGDTQNSESKMLKIKEFAKTYEANKKIRNQELRSFIWWWIIVKKKMKQDKTTAYEETNLLLTEDFHTTLY